MQKKNSRPINKIELKRKETNILTFFYVSLFLIQHVFKYITNHMIQFYSCIFRYKTLYNLSLMKTQIIDKIINEIIVRGIKSYA